MALTQPDYDHDVIVIGAGVAGLTAGFVSARHGLRTLVIDRAGVGGQINAIEHIDNFPGFPDGISGIELGPALQEQAEAAGAEFRLDEVLSLARSNQGEGWTVQCASDRLSAPAVIVATGSTLRALAVPGEDTFAGHGVSHCASCDGPFFRDEHVVVVGGGDSAVQEALVLAAHARNVTIVHEGPALSAQAALVNKLAEAPNIALRAQTRVERILGEKMVRSVVLAGPDGNESVEAAGVFPFVGLAPNNGLLADLVALDGEGRPITDVGMRLSVHGLYAAGDLRAASPAWLASVAGDGAAAAISAVKDLRARAEKR